ncbi:MAG: peptide deformylase [Spirochaetia bacterium]|nr:peptide deformylase [Spirochaetia bacterium]
MNILQFPNPRLREKSEPVKKVDEKTLAFIERLKEAMYINKGCVGIAAPQVGTLSRIVVVDVTGHKKAEQQSGLLVLINPILLIREGSVTNREGCLSVPDFTGNVERYSGTRYQYVDTDGYDRLLETSGFEAVAVQHEVDHLDGVLFIDRVRNAKRDLFKRKAY